MNDKLSSQLHQEGLAASPEFSAELHGRTMRALRRDRLRDAVRVMPPEPWRVVLAIAAALLIAASAWWAITYNSAITRPIGPTAPAPVAIAIRTPTSDAFVRAADPITQAISGVGAAPLEDIARDAKSMGTYFLRQLPTFTPQPQPARQL